MDWVVWVTALQAEMAETSGPYRFVLDDDVLYLLDSADDLIASIQEGDIPALLGHLLNIPLGD